MAIHKSTQGQILPQVVVDLGTAEKAAGISFVAISRVRSLQNLVSQPTYKQLEKGSNYRKDSEKKKGYEI